MAAAVLSGALLAASFPPLEQFQIAWASLVPLLLALPFADRRESFRLGFITGVVFWLISLWWLLRLAVTSPVPGAVIALGWIALSIYCALFVGAFGAAAGWLLRRFGTDKSLVNILMMILLAAVWVGFEYLRGVLFTGFPWNPLGGSQFRFGAIIQVAQWCGVYGVSALIVLVNAGLAFTILKHFPGRNVHGYRPHPELFVALALFAVCFRFGLALRAVYASGTPGNVTIAAIQPNVPQVQKWSEEYADSVYEKLRRLTLGALASCRESRGRAPDLIIWPETSVPDYALESEPALTFVRELLAEGTPILAGSMDAVGREDNWRFYNASLLFAPGGRVWQRYDKQHLVPFGEYIPLAGWLPFLQRLAPLGWSCTPGVVNTVFRLAGTPCRFSVLICFEDAIPSLARAAVRDGARLLITQTNDAWFDRSSAPVQHLSHTVFRCVENRVPAVRSANSGVTCFIDRNGQVYSETAEGGATMRKGEAIPPLVEAFAVAGVYVPEADMPLTSYARYGDILLAIPSAAVALLALLLALFSRGGAGGE
jgi:apolipoprotein N-acyltransferase